MKAKEIEETAKQALIQGLTEYFQSDKFRQMVIEETKEMIKSGEITKEMIRKLEA
ncbi:MAG: hypothetical protein WC138_11470 [Methanoculleus sp.]